MNIGNIILIQVDILDIMDIMDTMECMADITMMTLMVILMDGGGTGDLEEDSSSRSSHSSSSAVSSGNMFGDTQCLSHHSVSLNYNFSYIGGVFKSCFAYLYFEDL